VLQVALAALNIRGAFKTETDLPHAGSA